MTWYDFTVKEQTGEPTFSVGQRDSMLACVLALEEFGKRTGLLADLYPYTDYEITGHFLIEALGPLADVLMQLSIGHERQNLGIPLSRVLYSLKPDVIYVASYGDV